MGVCVLLGPRMPTFLDANFHIYIVVAEEKNILNSNIENIMDKSNIFKKIINEHILFGTMEPVTVLQFFSVSLREHKWFNNGYYS